MQCHGCLEHMQCVKVLDNVVMAVWNTVCESVRERCHGCLEHMQCVKVLDNVVMAVWKTVCESVR